MSFKELISTAYTSRHEETPDQKKLASAFAANTALAAVTAARAGKGPGSS